MERKEITRIVRGCVKLAYLFAWQMSLVVSLGVLYCKLTQLPCRYLTEVEDCAVYCFLFVLLGCFRIIDILHTVYRSYH